MCHCSVMINYVPISRNKSGKHLLKNFPHRLKTTEVFPVIRQSVKQLIPKNFNYFKTYFHKQFKFHGNALLFKIISVCFHCCFMHFLHALCLPAVFLLKPNH